MFQTCYYIPKTTKVKFQIALPALFSEFMLLGLTLGKFSHPVLQTSLHCHFPLVPLRHLICSSRSALRRTHRTTGQTFQSSKTLENDQVPVKRNTFPSTKFAITCMRCYVRIFITCKPPSYILWESGCCAPQVKKDVTEQTAKRIKRTSEGISRSIRKPHRGQNTRLAPVASCLHLLPLRTEPHLFLYS